MDVRFQCSHEDCGMVFPVEESFSHRKIPCPNCGHECLQVEEPESTDTTFSHIHETLDETRVTAKRYKSLRQVGKGGWATSSNAPTRPSYTVAMKVMRQENRRMTRVVCIFWRRRDGPGTPQHRSHPRIGTDEMHLYFTMKMVKGRSFEELI